MGCENSKTKENSNSPLKVHEDMKKKEETKKKGILEAKIVLLGETSVGKSSIALRYCQKKFSTTHEVTIGGSYFQENITLSSGNSLKIHIWDTGGSERFRAMLPLYYRDAQAAIVVYDIAQEKSFKGVNYWVDELCKKCDPEKIVIALAGNKCDLDDSQRKISKEMGVQFAKEKKMIFSETSAKTGDGINDLIKKIAEEIWQKQ
jgi:small GTP-binding protein